MATREDDARATTISPREVAARLGVTVTTLANWRWKGGGPAYLKVGGRVRYRIGELAAWLDEQVRASSSEGHS